MRSLLPIVLLCACASAPPPAPRGGPRGLRANEHLDLARQHDEMSHQASRWPDDPGPGPGGSGIRWVRSWDAAAEHERLAIAHRSQAAQLQAAYDEACGDRPVDEISISPLQRWGIGGTNTATGVTLYLTPKAGDPDRLMADMKCHRAWMMLAPAGMEDCPLDLPGIVVDAKGDLDGITVSIAVRDAKLVPELQRRAAHDLEAGASMQLHHGQ